MQGVGRWTASAPSVRSCAAQAAVLSVVVGLKDVTGDDARGNARAVHAHEEPGGTQLASTFGTSQMVARKAGARESSSARARVCNACAGCARVAKGAPRNGQTSTDCMHAHGSQAHAASPRCHICGRVCTTVMLPPWSTTPSTSCADPRAFSIATPT